MDITYVPLRIQQTTLLPVVRLRDGIRIPILCRRTEDKNSPIICTAVKNSSVNYGTVASLDFFQQTELNKLNQQTLHPCHLLTAEKKQDFFYSNKGECHDRVEGHLDSARVVLQTQNGVNAHYCVCQSKPRRKSFPSMTYDHVRCHHPQHRYNPVSGVQCKNYMCYLTEVSAYLLLVKINVDS